MTTPNFLYIAQAENKRIKIGITIDPVARIETLESNSPLYIYLLHFIETPIAYQWERRLHEFFEPLRHHGEWFDLSEKQIEWLCSLKADMEDEVWEITSDRGYNKIQHMRYGEHIQNKISGVQDRSGIDI